MHHMVYGTFADHLRTAMELRGVSARELGRRWRPYNPESGRTSVMRYLSGRVTPTPEKRDELAVLLDVPASMLPVPEYTQEHQLVADLKAALAEIKEIQKSMQRSAA